MGNSLYKLLLVLIFSLFYSSIFADVKVSDIQAYQKNKKIYISYKLNKKADIRIYLSTNGGYNYTYKLYKVKGDIGKNTRKGTNLVEWDALAEMGGEFVSDNVRFQIIAYEIESKKNERSEQNFSHTPIKKNWWIFRECDLPHNYLEFIIACDLNDLHYEKLNKESWAFGLSYTHLKSHLGVYTTMLYTCDVGMTAVVGPAFRLTSSVLDINIYGGLGAKANFISQDSSFGKNNFSFVGDVGVRLGIKRPNLSVSCGTTLGPRICLLTIGLNLLF